MGFFDDLGKAARFQAAINASKDSTGKPDPYATAGIVMGMGKGYSLKDAAILGITKSLQVSTSIRFLKLK